MQYGEERVLELLEGILSEITALRKQNEKTLELSQKVAEYSRMVISDMSRQNPGVAALVSGEQFMGSMRDALVTEQPDTEPDAGYVTERYCRQQQ